MSGVGEAGLSIAVLGLLGNIAKGVVEVKRYKKNCEELRKDCERISNIIAANTDALETSAVKPHIQSCLEKVSAFVQQCTHHWNYLHIGWEVMIEQKFSRLKDELSDLVKTLMFEAVVSLFRRSCKRIQSLLTESVDFAAYGAKTINCSSRGAPAVSHDLPANGCGSSQRGCTGARGGSSEKEGYHGHLAFRSPLGRNLAAAVQSDLSRVRGKQ